MRNNMTFKNFCLLIYKKNKILSCLIVALIFLASAISFSFINLLSNYGKTIADYEILNREDVQFVLQNQRVEQEAIMTIQNKYNIESLEIHASKFLNDGKQNIRAVKLPNKINALKILQGRLPQSDDEVVLEHTIASTKHYQIADTIAVFGKKYQIVGLVEYPNLVLPNMSYRSYSAVNVTEDVLLSLSDSAYASLILAEKTYYVAKGADEKKLQEDAAVFLTAQNNPELNILDGQRDMFMSSLGLGIGVLLSIIVILLFLVIYKTITHSIRGIGIMLALGYQKRNILSSLTFAILTYFFVSLFALLLSEGWKEALFRFFNGNHLVYYQPIRTIGNSLWVFGILLLVVFVLVYLFSHKLLSKKTTVSMISASGKNEISKFKKRLFKVTGRGITKKFILSDLMACFLLFFSGFSIIVQLFFSFGMANYVARLENSLNENYQYNYDYALAPINASSIGNREDSNRQFYFKTPVYIGQNENLNLVVLEDIPKQLIEFSGQKISRGGAVINKWMANKFKLNIGDTLGILLDRQTVELEISGINEQHYFGKEIYLTSDYYKQHINSQLTYNGVYSREPIHDIQDVDILFETKKENVFSIIDENIALLNVVSIVMFVLGIIISMIVMMIGLDVLLNNHKHNTGILKVLGYSDLKIYSMLILPQIIFVMLGTFIAIPYFNGLFTILFSEISKSGTLFYDFSVDIFVQVLLVLMVLVFFMLNSSFHLLTLVKNKNLDVLAKDR